MARYPQVELILSVGTWQTVIEAYPDTGFEGGLSIPMGAARELLAEPYDVALRLADDDLQWVAGWDGEVELEGRVFNCEVVALGSRYLLGREVLDHLEICFEFGRAVRLRFRDSAV